MKETFCKSSTYSTILKVSAFVLNSRVFENLRSRKFRIATCRETKLTSQAFPGPGTLVLRWNAPGTLIFVERISSSYLKRLLTTVTLLDSLGT
jgi:hypothetical protein